MYRVSTSDTERSLSVCIIPDPVQYRIDAAVLYGRSLTLLATQADTANPAAEQAALCSAGRLPRPQFPRGLFRARQRAG